MSCIDNMKQNHPELVVQDIATQLHDSGVVTSNYPLSAAFLRNVLKKRGINKWLANRKRLIWLKEFWKGRLRKSYDRLYALRLVRRRYTTKIEWNRHTLVPASFEATRFHDRLCRFDKGILNDAIRETHHLRGYVEALEMCRAQVRALCHAPRDIDFPYHPGTWPENFGLPESFTEGDCKPKRNAFSRAHNEEYEDDA